MQGAHTTFPFRRGLLTAVVVVDFLHLGSPLDPECSVRTIQLFRQLTDVEVQHVSRFAWRRRPAVHPHLLIHLRSVIRKARSISWCLEHSIENSLFFQRSRTPVWRRMLPPWQTMSWRRHAMAAISWRRPAAPSATHQMSMPRWCTATQRQWARTWKCWCCCGHILLRIGEYMLLQVSR